MNRRLFNQYITESNFRELFISEMGWNNVPGAAELPVYEENGETFHIEQIAERQGFQILQCKVDIIPTPSVCKKLDPKIRKNAENYICIFTTLSSLHHLWVAPVKKIEKRDIVLIEYQSLDQASFLFEKMEGLSFALDENPTIIDIIAKVQSTFIVNSERITNDFYRGFRKEHTNFTKFIKGIDDHVEDSKNKTKQWYTSVMLNRLMFCYFIQKKLFLDGDVDYLRHKLEWTQKEKGENRFFSSFYKGFLVNLFHGGLNARDHDDSFEKIYGKIPYLNGGMFDVHQIEQDYAGLDIKDEAFKSLFDFFDKWHWHLDDHMTASGRDINPDVLGYIFEQYINDRAQMGAYYTKEDITEYISRYTIIPYLLEAVREKDEQLFKPDGELWSFLKNSGDKYIFDEIKKGGDKPIPDDILIGIDTKAPNLLERRKRWNDRTPEEYGLQTEIWRETIDRLQRNQATNSQISKGEITNINDFITNNLDIRSFIYDFLSSTTNIHFIEYFYNALQHVTIIDPTCGSGAFLFAALNILEPLYEICIYQMKEFHKKDNTLFNQQLNEIDNKYRSNIQYYIYKSIILRNLYGVDIMAEAVEIAKLRLFLKMVAVVDVDKYADNMGLDPLPDIDFNIRCGNTLIGYATEEQLYYDLDHATDFLQQMANQELKEQLQSKLQDVSNTYEIYRHEQLSLESNIQLIKKAKTSLKNELSNLNGLLNKHLYTSTVQIDYNEWLETHQPFHWMAEFYQILHENKGFDVIIGNPPYVVYTKKDKETKKAISDRYKLDGYKTLSCNNLYAFVLERVQYLMHDSAKLGMIIPISSVSNDKFTPLLDILLHNMELWFSSYSNRPGKLFENVEQRLTIAVGGKSNNCDSHYYSCRYQHWNVIERPLLFKKLSFIMNRKDNNNLSLFKIGNPLEYSIYSKLSKLSDNLGKIVGHGRQCSYYHNGPTYFIRSMSFKPNSGPNMQESSHYKELWSSNNTLVACVLNSSIFYWYYKNISNCRDFSDREILSFPICKFSEDEIDRLEKLLKKSYISHRALKSREYDSGLVYYEEYYPAKSKSIIDDIDLCLAKSYSFTPEEIDYIINYDIKYRMGDELTEE